MLERQIRDMSQSLDIYWFRFLGSTWTYSRHFTDAIRYLSRIKNDVYFSFCAALSVILTIAQFDGAVVVHDHDEKPYAGWTSTVRLRWSTISSLIEEGSFRLGERDDVRSPRPVYDRVIFESITETLNDTTGILISKSFAAFLNHRHLKTTIC